MTQIDHFGTAEEGSVATLRWVVEITPNWVVDFTEIRRLEEVHEISTKTAKRDLSDLVKRDLIEYVRKPHSGFYRGKA